MSRGKNYHTEMKMDITDELYKTFEKMRGSFVSVGVHEDVPNYDNDSTKPVAMIAAVHEFGSNKTPSPIPERSFLRSTYDENFEKISNDMQNYIGDIAKKRLTIEAALGKVGFEMAEKTKNKIKDPSAISPPNTESTAKTKGFNNPLYDSGHLMRSIDFEVVIRKGKGKYAIIENAPIES